MCFLFLKTGCSVSNSSKNSVCALIEQTRLSISGVVAPRPNAKRRYTAADIPRLKMDACLLKTITNTNIYIYIYKYIYIEREKCLFVFVIVFNSIEASTIVIKQLEYYTNDTSTAKDTSLHPARDPAKKVITSCRQDLQCSHHQHQGQRRSNPGTLLGMETPFHRAKLPLNSRLDPSRMPSPSCLQS